MQQLVYSVFGSYIICTYQAHHHHHHHHHHLSVLVLNLLNAGTWYMYSIANKFLVFFFLMWAIYSKSGLQRCGKSCRLRWTNYLRPDIKRGAFTASEEQKIIQLHALVGNKYVFHSSIYNRVSSHNRQDKPKVGIRGFLELMQSVMHKYSNNINLVSLEISLETWLSMGTSQMLVLYGSLI